MYKVSSVLVTSLFICLTILLFLFSTVRDFSSFAAVNIEYGEFSSPESESSNTVANLYLVGDVMLARDVERTIFDRGLDYPYLNLLFDKETDLVVANFEASIPQTHVKTPNHTFRFSVDKRLLPPLREAGFTHLSLANNHTFDYGGAGFNSTKNSLAVNDFVTFGHPTIFSSSSVSFLELADKKVALVALHLLFSTPSDEALSSVLSYASDNSDLQILYVHWGNEYAHQHSAAQYEMAKKVADQGVDIIVGHHPHVVQDIGKIGNTLVFYSLGNFIFDQYFSKSVQQGLMLRLDQDLNIELLPVTSEESRAQPRFLIEEKRQAFLSNIALNSDPTLGSQIESGMILYANMLATSSEVAIMAP